MSRSANVSYGDIEAAAERLSGVAHRTPVLTSRQLNEATGCQVFLKAENCQRTGSFKFRGAYNSVALHKESHPDQGILAYSSGNHAQAIAHACSLLDVENIIVMPDDAPAVKLAATRGYGGQVVLYNRFETTREKLGQEIATKKNLAVIPAYDHRDVIAGQGTAVAELLSETGPLDLLLVCCGGGGLLSGSALSARHLAPGCRIVGVEPELADDAARSFRSGTLQTVENPPTIADGARTPSLGNITFPLVLALVDDIVTVSDEALVRAMAFCWERLKSVVEPTGALALAGLLEAPVQARPGLRIGVTLSGGNVDLDQAATLLQGAGSASKDAGP